MSDPEAVLGFWFGAPATDAASFQRQVDRWFRGGEALDREIRERFADLHARAARGELEAWAGTPRGRLALIILLDQFSRHLYRDTAQAHAQDAAAQALAVGGLDAALDRPLEVPERMFFAMPLMHAEDLNLQERALRYMVTLHAAAPDYAKPALAVGVEQAKKYLATITRYGRFPHRNACLGRESTPEETAFLATFERDAPASAPEAARAVVDAINRAWVDGRVEAMERHLHPDMVIVAPDGRVAARGRAACVASYRDFAGRARVTGFQTADPQIELYGDTAVVTYAFELGYETAGHPARDAGREVFVLARGADGWKAVWRALLPVPPAAG